MNIAEFLLIPDNVSGTGIWHEKKRSVPPLRELTNYISRQNPT